MVEDINYAQKVTNNLAEITVFPSENSFLIQRTYIKLQNILAQVFTVLNLFFIVFSIFFNIIYESKMKEIFYKKVYEGFEEKGNVKFLKPNTNKLIELSNISNSNIQINHDNNLIKDDITNNNLNLTKISHVNNAENDNINNNDVISISKYKTRRKSLHVIAKNDVNYQNFKDLNIRFCEYFAFLFCSCFHCNFNEKYGKLIQNIHFCVQKNVIYFTKKIIEIEKIKEILFDEDQLAEFNSIDNLMFLESDCDLQNKFRKD